MRGLRIAATVPAAALPAAASAKSRPYPNRPLLLLVPYAAGGSIDIIAPLLAETRSDAPDSRAWRPG